MWRVMLAILMIGGTVAAALLLVNYLDARRRVSRRWFAEEPGGETVVASHSPRGWLSQWLYIAGYRGRYAAWWFVATTLTCAGVGFGSAVAFQVSGLQTLMEQTVVLVPGGIGDTFLPVVWVAPWLIAILLVCIPWVIVRAKRRKRVMLVEQDLPLAMELMATLSEAGLGFDAALARILNTRLAGRPLANELRIYRSDLLAGRPRIESLRRLSGRMRIGSISILVSALVQAEQMGMGIARVLRTQADDVRARRRERALTFANALPVKRLFPLVICFLPGLFVWTLGPAFIELFKIAEAFTRGSGL